MNKILELIVGALVLSFAGPVTSWLFYKSWKIKANEYNNGIAFSWGIHELVFLELVLISFFYSFMPAVSPDDGWWLAMVSLSGAFNLIPINIAMYLTGVRLAPERRNYFSLISAGYTAANSVLLTIALAWMMDLPIPWPTIRLMKATSFAVPLLVELMFLHRNKWEILPKDPK